MGNKQSMSILSDIIHDLAVDLYDKFVESASDKCCQTFIYSPFQTFCSIFIYYLSTDGDTKRQLLHFLRLEKNANDGAIQNALTKLINDLHQNQTEDDTYGILTMSGIFLSVRYREEVQLKFRKNMMMFANKVELQFVDFNYRLIKSMVDRWAKECTCGNITCSTGNDFLAPPLFHVDLFSIVDQFDFTCTKANAHASNMLFYDSSNNVTEVPSTYVIGKFKYIHDVTYKIRIIELGLKSNSELGVLIILPENRQGSKNVKSMRSLKSEVKMWLESLTVESELEVFLPRIKMSSLVKMDEILNRSAASEVFREHSADLSGMARLTTVPLFLTSMHANYNLDLSFDLKRDGVSTSYTEPVIYQESIAVPYRVEHPFKIIIYHRIAKTIYLVANVENVTGI